MRGNIFYSILKPLAMVIFVALAIGVGVIGALLAFQNIFYVPDTVVPDLIGEELEAAREKLQDAGLGISVSGEEFNEKISENRIIKQKPPAGSKVKKNREIQVVISKGSKSFTVNIPDLRNKDLEEAINLLEEKGLTVGKITYVSHFSIPQDKVIAQTPEPGEATVSDKTVNLLVSKGTY